QASLFVRLDRRAGADQVAVARGRIHQPDRGPELVLERPRRRERRLLPRVRTIPLIRGHRLSRVRRILERIVPPIHLATLDRADLLADPDQPITEPVELLERLALRRL